jgi:hypothetical protein
VVFQSKNGVDQGQPYGAEEKADQPTQSLQKYWQFADSTLPQIVPDSLKEIDKDPYDSEKDENDRG